MSCASEDTLVALAAGELSDDARETLLRHLDTCHECRELVADVLRDGEETPAPGHESLRKLALLPRAGDELGRYVLLEWLASGGMGMVFSAYDPGLDRRVAVKLIAPRTDELAVEELRRRLQHEALALARVMHPNVVRVYDVGRIEGSVFVVMEFVDGGTLARHEADAPSWERVVELYLQAGRGLAAAHAANIVHRDFKPENVLVDRAGRAKVADFGLAESGRPEVGAEASRRVGGTRHFMAPEQVEGASTPRSDQYSFAVALGGALARHAPRVPTRVHAIVQRARSGAPDERYPSMTELLAGLEAELRRAAFARTARVVVSVFAALSVFFIVMAHLARGLGGGSDWLHPTHLALLELLETLALVWVALRWRTLFRDRVLGPIFRIAYSAFAVEMLVGLGLSLSPRTRPFVVPAWILIHGYAVGAGGVLVDPLLYVAAASAALLFVLACASPGTGALALTASGVVIAATVLVSVKRALGRAGPYLRS